MIWVIVWLVCASGSCWPEIVEQEFETAAECRATLAWYQARDGVIGICREWDAR